jgi:hypothetical protein
MTKFTFLAFIASIMLLSSCGADQAVVDKMADEMCTAMSKYDENDPMSLLSCGMLDIATKEDEYGSVTESQLNETMEKKCPDGYKKFKKITETGN